MSHACVIESVTRFVCRKVFGYIDFESEQIADRVLVLGPIESLELWHVARVRRIKSRGIKSSGEVLEGRTVFCWGWPLRGQGRHLSRTYFANYTLPNVTVALDGLLEQTFKVQAAFRRTATVAVNAISCCQVPVR